jgi:Cu+-exporting ATPase
MIAGKRYFVGSAELMNEKGIPLPAAGIGIPESMVFVSDEGTVLAGFSISDRIKDGMKSAVRALAEKGIGSVMLTGDSRDRALKTAEKLGITDVRAEVLPEGKLTVVREVQEKGEIVAVTGDGINDAPALKQADVGIAMGTGTDIAMDSADIILVKSRPEEVIRLLGLSRAAFRKIRQNLFWAFFYNMVAIPLAMAGAMHPLVAEVAMTLSSLNVIFNSLSIRKAKID